MSRVTQADVVRGAIKQIEKRGGFTVDTYYEPKKHADAPRYVQAPGDMVGATCAIGGVEQAIWRLTGQDVSDDRWAVKGVKVSDPAVRRTLYGGVMNKLNAKARKLFGDLGENGDPIINVEDVTFLNATKTTTKKRVLEVFNSVLSDLEKTKASA